MAERQIKQLAGEAGKKKDLQRILLDVEIDKCLLTKLSSYWCAAYISIQPSDFTKCTALSISKSKPLMHGSQLTCDHVEPLLGSAPSL